MRKKYVSPLFAELELENVLYDSDFDNKMDDADDPDWGSDNDFDQEENFDF